MCVRSGVGGRHFLAVDCTFSQNLHEYQIMYTIRRKPTRLPGRLAAGGRCPHSTDALPHGTSGSAGWRSAHELRRGSLRLWRRLLQGGGTELRYANELKHKFVDAFIYTGGVEVDVAETLRASLHSLFVGGIKGNKSFLLPTRGVYKVSY